MKNRSLSNLLSIAPGEEQKTSLLYLLHMLFYLGLMWGNAARETLFLSAWKSEDLALIFIIYAIVGFMMGIAYTFAADRISNSLLLKIILGIMVLWLGSVRILLYTNGGERALVYPYFYVAYSAFSDLSTMHILMYINDFYDTRASKRALPLLLSAGIAGGTLAGFSAKFLNDWIGLKNTPIAWAVILIICFALILVIERRLGTDLDQIERLRKKSIAPMNAARAQKANGLQNMREGFNFVRQSGLLRSLAAATLIMVMLMNLLTYQAYGIFAVKFENNPNGLFNFYSLLSGISNVSGLLIQSLFLSRLVNWFGVGAMNLVFPVVTLGAVASINFAPGFASAIFSRLDYSAIKQTFRNPLDAMLYNSVPIASKTRARGFINGLIVPLGTLAAGLTILAVKAKLIQGPMIVSIGLSMAVLYLLVMFNVRREYGRSMTSLLAGDELGIFNQDQSEVLPPDPATVLWLRDKLQNLPADANTDGQAVFISQILYDMDARTALPLLFEFFERRGSFFRKGILELLDQSNLNQPDFAALCQRSLHDPEAVVREAAAGALLNFIKRNTNGETEASILNSLHARLEELELGQQAQLISLLIQHGSLVQQTNAQNTLDHWLKSAAKDNGEASAPTLAAGLSVLVEIERQRQQNLHGSGFENNTTLRRKLSKESSRLKDLSINTLQHPAPSVRLQLIPSLVQQCKYTQWDSEHWAVQSLLKLLEDPEENIRLAIMEELQAETQSLPLMPLVWQALNDPSLAIRRLACKLPIAIKFTETQMLRSSLDAAAMQAAPLRAESAIYLLIQSRQRGMETLLGKTVESLTHDTYWMTLQGAALKDLAQSYPGARLMLQAFQEASNAILERAFWLMSADSSEEQTQAVQRALPSSDPTERANAAEALEATLPPVVARQLARLLDGSPTAEIVTCAKNELGMREPNPMQVLQNTWAEVSQQNTRTVIPQRLQFYYRDGWLTAIAIYLFTETSSLALPPQTLREALQETLKTDTRPHVQDAARLALASIVSNTKETTMSASHPLSLIEKVIFLKEVPFFSELSLQEISILAGISEEVSYPPDYKIFAQGDNTKTLYLVIRGQVSVQQETRTGSIVRLKVLGAKNYFAETSLFDGAAHQADVVTTEAVDILMIRQSMFFTLIRRRPDIGLSLLKALSQRLRETYAQVAQNERAKPKQLVSLYDKMEK